MNNTHSTINRLHDDETDKTMSNDEVKELCNRMSLMSHCDVVLNPCTPCASWVQGKLEMVVGTPVSCMDLELYSTSDQFLVKMDDNDALLGSYPVDDDCRIHVGRRW